MSVRQSLLVLLAEQDRHGYQLRQEFEQRTGGTWPINIGQIYTTINRLQRDGLVVEVGRQDDGSVIYHLTGAGREEAALWWATPVDRSAPAREELAIKLALAVTSPGVDVAAVLRRQRTESLRALQVYTQHKRRVPDRPSGPELARLLVLDNLIHAVEAEVRWLDAVEQRLVPVGGRAGVDTGVDPGPVLEHPRAGPPPGGGSAGPLKDADQKPDQKPDQQDRKQKPSRPRPTSTKEQS